MFRESRAPSEIVSCSTCLRSIKVNWRSRSRLSCLRKVRFCLSLRIYRCLLKGLYLQSKEKEKINRINEVWSNKKHGIFKLSSRTNWKNTRGRKNCSKKRKQFMNMNLRKSRRKFQTSCKRRRNRIKEMKWKSLCWIV